MMDLNILTPKKSLNKAYLREKVGRDAINRFKANLAIMLAKINEQESEEHLKNIVSEFLKDTWYKDLHEINTKERNDLVIYSGKSSKDSVGVIIEAKRPSNKTEMISVSKPNCKALHEVVLYYLKERIEHTNVNVKHLIITNIYEWYILDENWFDKFIFRNSRLKKQYESWSVEGKDTRFFYESIVKPYLDDLNEAIPCTYFDLRSLKNLLSLDKSEKDNSLLPYYKIFSPPHLLKESFKNDSNSLDPRFYVELLHILGLEEKPLGSKIIIDRKTSPNEGSLIENTISKLKSRDSLRNIPNATAYGQTTEEQLFNVSLELTITWINRILFLKLLEAQLFNFHKSDKAFLFLNIEKVFDFDELSNLFFSVLAERPTARPDELKEKFKNVPYLNSSLFDRIDLEKLGNDIGNLDNRKSLPLHEQTVLKDRKGKRKIGFQTTLEYLFNFLDAYDFTSEGSEEIQEENKNLINASVLGLIFEKINGYKDGSFFTPGYITMYISKEALGLAVIRKFNEHYQIECETLNDLKNYLSSHFKAKEILEFNTILNELKICDPAVGSGHFLVSALNELIAIKAKLGILADSNGVRLNDYEFRVENDELIITYNDNSEIFEYTVSNRYIDPKIQRIQETIFHEKQTIIENCLFGVDLNPNSVKICRLRLWIELLKTSYYTKESGYKALETLPNIDINIKCGNSLINRFELSDDLQTSFKDKEKTFKEYKDAVKNYKLTNDKKQKETIWETIESIKSSFEVSLDAKFKKEISKARGAVTNYESEINRRKQWQEAVTAELLENLKKSKTDLRSAESKKEDILHSKIYSKSFEWRFEFPEVLDENENFVGFDVVVGNPPYIPLEDLTQEERDLFRNKYVQFERKFETSVLFMVQGFNLLKPNGLLAYIAPVTWQTGENYPRFREYIFDQKGLIEIINLPFNVFADAYVETAIYVLSNSRSKAYRIFTYGKKEVIKTFENIAFSTIESDLIKKPKYKIILNPFVSNLIENAGTPFTTLGSITISTQGLAGSSFKPVSKPTQKHFPFLSKGNVYNYLLEVEETFETSLEDKPSLIPFYEAKPKLLIRRIINRQDRLSVGYTDQKMVFKKDINPFIVNDPSFDTKFLLAVMASRLISFIYLNLSTIASKDDFRQTTLAELREVPIPDIQSEKQRPFIILADYLLLLAKHGKNSSFFERLVDALVYEYYFPKQVVNAGCSISLHLTHLPPLDKENEELNIKLVERQYKALSDPKNDISSLLLKLLNIKEINLVEGRP
jgi:adenine-specific DNA-methyltransferase